MVTTETLIYNAELRDKISNHVEILDKVKELVMFPRLKMMTIAQVAAYYEVGEEAIRTCYARNKQEIMQDGADTFTVNSVLGLIVQNEQVTNKQGCKEVTFDDGTVLRFPNRGITLFPKRAVLRIGMLLRDSEVANEVRTQLLNILENSSDETKTQELDKEMELYTDLAKAFCDGSKEDMMVKMQEIVQYQKRHINALSTSNEMLTGEILQWDNRSAVSKAVNVLAGSTGTKPGFIWKELYEELRYKFHMGLSQRGKSPYIQWVKDDEWENVQKCLAAICEKRGISAAVVFEKAKIA